MKAPRCPLCMYWLTGAVFIAQIIKKKSFNFEPVVQMLCLCIYTPKSTVSQITQLNKYDILKMSSVLSVHFCVQRSLSYPLRKFLPGCSHRVTYKCQATTGRSLFWATYTDSTHGGHRSLMYCSTFCGFMLNSQRSFSVIFTENSPRLYKRT